MSANRYASKPDANRAAIVAALKAAGASVVDLQGRPGTPDVAWGYRGRMGLAEIKVPGKEHGVCGCSSTDPAKCLADRFTNADGFNCGCKGHVGTGNAERTVWHRQLAWHEAWKGPPVAVWTTAEEALLTIRAERELER